MNLTKSAGMLFSLLCCGVVLSTHVHAESREVSAGPLKLQVPSEWKQRQPSSNLRLAEFAIPAKEEGAEAAELSVFGPFGGSVEANVGRWVNQFDAEGRKVEMVQGTGTQGKYVLVNISGTFKKPVGPPILQKTESTPGQRMLAIMLIVEGQGNFFLKLTGSDELVTATSDALRASIGAKADGEEPYAP
ncbi:MAG: hypothetical protein R3C18_20415 [Planctomycetaceae bacterium]